jgi:hypothetical protein
MTGSGAIGGLKGTPGVFRYISRGTFCADIVSADHRRKSPPKRSLDGAREFRLDRLPGRSERLLPGWPSE